MVTTTLVDVATAWPICVPPSKIVTVSPAVTPVTMNCSSLPALELLSEVIWSLLLLPVSEAARSVTAVGAAGLISTGTACVSGEELTELDTPNSSVCTPGASPLDGVSVTTPVAELTLIESPGMAAAVWLV